VRPGTQKARGPGVWAAARVVVARELGDLWLAGRGPALTVAFAVVLSVTTYLVASNRALNFLEQREAVALTVQLAVAVGALLVALGAADAVSGERERGTLESLLLTPAPRRSLVAGKALAALSLWGAAFVVSVPYLVYLAGGVGSTAAALESGLLVGSLLAVFVAGLATLVSSLVASNRLSLSITLFVLLALYAPTQMPTAVGWVGETLRRLDPFTAGTQVLSDVVLGAGTMRGEVGWLASPLLGAAVAAALSVGAAGRLALGKGAPA
jgi:ABC-2 type transport system permease protein